MEPCSVVPETNHRRMRHELFRCTWASRPMDPSHITGPCRSLKGVAKNGWTGTVLRRTQHQDGSLEHHGTRVRYL